MNLPVFNNLLNRKMTRKEFLIFAGTTFLSIAGVDAIFSSTALAQQQPSGQPNPSGGSPNPSGGSPNPSGGSPAPSGATSTGGTTGGSTTKTACAITKVGSPKGEKPPLPSECTQAGGGGAAAGCTAGGGTDPEPPDDSSRTSVNGKTINNRTKTMLTSAEKYAQGLGVPTPFIVTQGSYNKGGVSASAGTHDGGGVLDIGINNMNTEQRNNAIKALRMAGFAAWERFPKEGFPPHIHAVAIGDKELSPAAAAQVKSYFAGKNGLSGNGPDTAPTTVGRPVPGWAGKHGNCTTFNEQTRYS